MTQTKRNTPVIKLIERNDSTNELEIREVELAVPKWGWQYLQMRADALYEGDLNVAVNEILSAGLMAYLDLSEISMEPANQLPC